MARYVLPNGCNSNMKTDETRRSQSGTSPRTHITTRPLPAPDKESTPSPTGPCAQPLPTPPADAPPAPNIGTDDPARPLEIHVKPAAHSATPAFVVDVTHPSAAAPRHQDGGSSTIPSAAPLDQPLQARMLNEFVYCPRLFYYEYVEGVFLASHDTLRGDALHRRVDSGSGALPQPAKADDAGPAEPAASPQAAPEIIHSRSVQMGSEKLGVVAKMDLVEARRDASAQTDPDLFDLLEVRPVDYKAGSPREGENGNELWDTDRMQLGLQVLILRHNGYTCNEGVIYYRGTKQRVTLPMTPELEAWITENIAGARRVTSGPIPAPLEHSPKCGRCSLAPVCLPDETRMLEQDTPGTAIPRRLIAARDDERSLYLNTQGVRVGCSGGVLKIKEKDRLVDEVRIRDLSHVALFGNVQVSTQAVQALCEQEVPITFFSMGGWFYGITRGHGLKNIFLRIRQFEQAAREDTCLALARFFVHGKIRNHRTLLMRNHIEPPEHSLGKLKCLADEATRAGSLPELLGIEGAAASVYFEHFAGMLKPADPAREAPQSTPHQPEGFTFSFTNRNRRPPTDPVNAMLSLAYSMLSKDCTLMLLAVGFDPYLGFYHQPRFGRPALALDLMEEFRPLIAESVVLTCVNNRVIRQDDFIRAGQAVNLDAPARKRFFQIYEQRMSTLITHPLFDYKVSYRRAIELQARLLAKTLTGEIARYVPLTTR